MSQKANLIAMLERMAAERDAEDAREAAAAGVSLEQYRATQDAIEAQRQRAEAARELAELRTRRLAPMLAGLRPDVAELAIAGELEATQPIRLVRRWLRNPQAPQLLVLCGETGTGKTVACAEVLASVNGEYVQASELAARFEPYSGDLSRGVKPLHVAAHRMLLLDDVGTERTNRDGSPDARFAPAMLKVFDQRQGSVLAGGRRVPMRTLITTNLDEADFVERYATEKRVKSRLGDVKYAYFAACGDEDRRAQ